MFRAGSDDIDSLKRRVVDGVSKLKGLDIGDELAVEILSQLVQGRKTITEITEGIYGLSRSDEGFGSCFNRVGREVRRLESKGLVSRRLFGNNRPYRLTQHAVINLAKIGGEESQVPLIPKADLAVYVVTAILSVPNAIQAMNWVELSGTPTIILLTSFFFFLGVSSYGAVRLFRRVL